MPLQCQPTHAAPSELADDVTTFARPKPCHFASCHTSLQYCHRSNLYLGGQLLQLITFTSQWPYDMLRIIYSAITHHKQNWEEGVMRTDPSSTLGVILAACVGFSALPSSATAGNVPSALDVEWNGKKLCEALYEDENLRAARCTFPKGSMHVCHSHPSYLLYAISGGPAEVQDEKGTRKSQIIAGSFANVPPVPWHIFTNTGEETIQFLVVEKKYQPSAAVDESACPKNKACAQRRDNREQLGEHRWRGCCT